MKILVANLGSTSFKYRLFDLSDPAEPVLARGAIERIGSANAKVVDQVGPGRASSWSEPIADHGEAVQLCLDQLTDPEIGVLDDAARGRGDRLQGGPRAEPHRRAPGRRRRCWPRWRPSPTSPPRTIRRTPRRCGCSATGSRGCRWSPRSRPASTGRFPRRTSATRSPTSGRPSSASAAGGSTAPAIATSPAGWPSCWAATTSS